MRQRKSLVSLYPSLICLSRSSLKGLFARGNLGRVHWEMDIAVTVGCQAHARLQALTCPSQAYEIDQALTR